MTGALNGVSTSQVMENYAGRSSPRLATAAKAAGGATAASLPPPPPFDESEVKGLPVIKDFWDAKKLKMRPFKGKITQLSFRVKYDEDNTEEDLCWEDVYPLLQRAAAGQAKAKGEAASTAKRAKPQALAQQTAAAAQADSDARLVPKPRGRPPSAQRKQEQERQEQHQEQRQSRRLRQELQQEQQQEQQQQQQQQPAPKPRGRPPKQQAQGGSGAAGAAAGQAAPASAAEERPQQAPQPAPQKGKKRKSEAAAGSAAAQGASKQAAKGSKKPKASAAEAAAAGAGAGGEGAAAGAAPKQKQAKGAARPVVDLPMPQLDRKYEYTPGQEPWRTTPGFSWRVQDEPDLSAGAVKELKHTQRLFNKYFIEAQITEEVRAAKVLAEQKANGTSGKKGTVRPSERPDRAVDKRFNQEGLLAQRGLKVAGYFPGWPIASRAYSRSELCCIGFHHTPLGGIDFVGAGKAGRGAPPFAVSVMISGWYQDDDDENPEEVWYTGEGGNDLLGTRKQNADQVLKRGNLALVGNIQLGIPVRVTRKQKDNLAPFGCNYVFDGLYDVVQYRFTAGKEGTKVYQFLLKRRPNQGPLLSQRVEWGAVKAPKLMAPNNRQGVVTLDVSCGQEEQPIPAVDDTWQVQGDDREPQGAVPPCTALEDIVDESELVGKVVRGVNQQRIDQLRAAGYRPTVEYITKPVFAGKAVEAARHLKPATLPDEYADDPHAWLKKLNHGKLPYSDKTGQLFSVRPDVYECCPDWDCGHNGPEGCPQRVTQRPPKPRLELFMTKGTAWGVRTLDTIYQFQHVVDYVGEVYDAQEHEHLVRTVEEKDAEYTFSMNPRPDCTWDGSQRSQEEEEQTTHFVCCGQRRRNIAAFINHSCNPNLFVQPVLTTHHDQRMCKISFFAMETIPPLTELTFDYGAAQVTHFPGGCQCGAPDCVSRGPQGVCAAAGAARQADGRGEEEQADAEEEQEDEAAASDEEGQSASEAEWSEQEE